MDLEGMIVSTPRYEGVDSINIHDGSMYALSTHPAPANPSQLNFTPSPRASVCSCITLNQVPLFLCLCVHVHVHECADV